MKTRMAENANIKENEIQKEIKKETGEEQKMLKNEYLSEINLDDRFELREIRLGAVSYTHLTLPTNREV